MVTAFETARGLFWRVALFSAVALLFQVILTRLFSVAQFYHFAFMIISIAMLGYAVSGVILAFRRALTSQQAIWLFEWCALASSFSILAAYLILNGLPFDSFSIAWDARQLLLFALNYFALSLPFFLSGLALGVLLNAFPHEAGKIYAWNFIGAGLGCLGGLVLPGIVGGEGVIVVCCALLALCGLPSPLTPLPEGEGKLPSPSALLPEDEGRRPSPLTHLPEGEVRKPSPLTPLPKGEGRRPSPLTPLPEGEGKRPSPLTPLPEGEGKQPSPPAPLPQGAEWIRRGAILLWVGLCVLELIGRSRGVPLFPALNLRLSPYKSLSYALQFPEAQLIFQRWNAFSRVEVVRSRGIRSVPGMSFNYAKPLPPQAGVFVDGDNLSPLLSPTADLEFTAYLPQAVAFWLRPDGRALVLEPRGGMDILVALQQGAAAVTAVEVNPLVVEVAHEIYTQPSVTLLIEDQRSFTRRTLERFDVILLSLTSSFHPVRSGAYSLAEDYRYTRESLRELIALLQPQGVLVFNRWLQKPPSEELRAFATVVEALESLNLDPQPRLVVLRGYAMATFLVKRQPFTTAEMAVIRQFVKSRAFDLIYAPDLRPEETNRFNVLAESLYTPAFQAVLDPQTRHGFYRSYPYDVRPATDDHPFFAHYFKWSQTRQTLAEFGQSWQPFGGAGMFVVVGLLGFVVVLGGVLVGLTAWALTPGPSPAGRGETALTPDPSPAGRGETALTPGSSPGGEGEEIFIPGPSPGGRGEETLTPDPSPGGRGKTVLTPGSSPGGEGEETLTPSPSPGGRGEETLTPDPSPGGRGETALTPGSSPEGRGEETLTPDPSPAGRGEEEFIQHRSAAGRVGSLMVYFTAIGFAYLLVEIALIHRFQLYLAQPAYAVAGVLFALLVSSGVGSLISPRVPLRFSLLFLVFWIATSTWWLRGILEATLALPFGGRVVLLVLLVFPFGLGMGMAFPGGLRHWLPGEAHAHWLPLVWSVNGAASVIASVGAMLLALSFGFSVVFQMGALLYGIAWLTVWARERRSAPLRP